MLEILCDLSHIFNIYPLIESHVPKDAEGDGAGQQTGGGVDQAGDDGIPGISLVKLSVFAYSDKLFFAVTRTTKKP